MHKSVQAIAVTVLSLAIPITVQAQQPQWVQITTTDGGDRIFFDTASQVKVFDAGVKQNTFSTLTLATAAGKRSFRQRYQADCFKGTLALRGLKLVNAQGSVLQDVPLNRADQVPFVPEKDTVVLDIWRYACAQF